jgi:hypothetical protein
MKFITQIASATTLLCWIALANVSGGQDAKTVSFENHIKPILENHCVRCHGPEKEESFRIDRRDSAMDYVSANEPEESDLYNALVSDDEDVLMPPPDENDPLDESDIKLVETWIREGAEWPEGIVLVAVENQFGDSDSSADQDSDSKADADAAADQDSTADPDADSDQAQDDKQDANAKSNVNKNAPKSDAAKKNKPDPWNAVGSLHPATVHLPIGLLLAGGLFALLSLRGNFVMSDCAYYCLWLGTIGAIIACATGWWFSPMEHRGTVTAFEDLWNMEQKVFWHRTSALIATVVALLLSLFAASARSRDPDDGIVWKLGLIVLAFGIGFVGYEGGELTWGKDHYKDIQGYLEPYIDFGKADSNGEEDGSTNRRSGAGGGDPSTGDVDDHRGGAASAVID